MTRSVPSEIQRLDQDILRLTALVWIAHWGILTTSAMAVSPGGFFAAATLEAAGWRLIVASFGAAFAMGIHYLLRGRSMRPVMRFMTAAGLAVAAAVLLDAVNEGIWLANGYYEAKLGLSLGGILEGQCSADFGPCANMLSEAVYSLAFFIWVYAAWCGLYAGTVMAAEVRDRDRRLAIAESATQEARINALRFQLNPHFLFNTLNTISGLVAVDRKPQAEHVILNLSTFMRYSLASGRERFVALAEELEAQRMYLDIERVRFAERLNVEFDVEPECEAASVPPFILQPLVENAIKYAVAPSEAAVTIRISARRKGGDLLLSVDNSAPSTHSQVKPPSLGIGITNVQTRLQALYGERACLSAGAGKDGGWSNALKLPWVKEA